MRGPSNVILCGEDICLLSSRFKQIGIYGNRLSKIIGIPNMPNVVCTTRLCNNQLGNNNQSGFCRSCAQKKNNPRSAKTVTDFNDGSIYSADELSMELLNSPITELTLGGMINVIHLLQKPLVEQMSKMDDDVKGLTLRLDALEAKSATVEGSLQTKTTEIADIKTKLTTSQTIEAQHNELRKVIDNHQRYLEKTDSYRRESNVVVFGFEESENDVEKIGEMFRSVGCVDIVPGKVKRLGKPPDNTASETPTAGNGHETPEVTPEVTVEGGNNAPPRPRIRPLLVTLKSEIEKKTILGNCSKLKGNELYKTVFVKKDQTPQERKEWARLRTVVAREKDRPENQGSQVKLDYRRRCVMVGDRVIERGNFRFGPEM